MINIVNNKDCTGCHACYSICPQNCISMDRDPEGFWYPKVDYDKCIDCGLCEKVCPIQNKIEIINKPQAYACINKDELIRIKSSSGGIFTLIAEEIIDLGGVVFGAMFNNNFEVIHSYVETKEELSKLRGSKYVQSRIGETYKRVKDFLNEERKVLFTGTPCQISGLKLFLGNTYDNLVCMDIVCHGVPSPSVLEKYIKYREKQANSKTKRIAFRRKYEGWKQFSVSFLFENNTEYRQTLHTDFYMKAFLKNVCLRPSCYECSFKTIHRESDMTLAGFWGIQNILPDMDDDKGTSLIFVNSIVGQDILNEIKSKIILKEVDIDKALKYNSAAIKSVEYNEKRKLFFNDLNSCSFDKLIKRNCSDKIILKLKRKVKYLIYGILKKTRLLRFVKNVLGK